MEAWSKVNAAVHAKGGLTALQLWHTGRISPFLAAGRRSAGGAVGDPGGQPHQYPRRRRRLVREQCDTPRALEVSELADILKTTAAPPTTRAAPASTWWKSMAPTAIC